MVYKLLGMLVWKCMKYALRQKYGAAMVPKPLLAGGLRARDRSAVVAARRASAATADPAERRLRPHCAGTALPRPPRRLTAFAAVESSSSVPALDGLAIEAVEWLPSGSDAGLVRVRGRWSDPVPA